MTLSRRKLLLVGGGVVCAHAIGCGGGESIVLPKEIPAGSSYDLTAGTIRVVSTSAVAVARDGSGIYALSLVCTHQGCDIRSSQGSISFNLIHCGCHGSEFNGQGGVLVGPASRPLPHLLVTADPAGALTVHGDTEVPATTRLT